MWPSGLRHLGGNQMTDSSSPGDAQIFICRRSRADLEVSFGVLVLVHVVVDVVLEPLPLLSE